eukprot:1314972-Pleurochrysis_carterae.AAC.2
MNVKANAKGAGARLKLKRLLKVKVKLNDDGEVLTLHDACFGPCSSVHYARLACDTDSAAGSSSHSTRSGQYCAYDQYLLALVSNNAAEWNKYAG